MASLELIDTLQDPLYIWAFRLTGEVWLDLFLGLFWVALFCSMVGELAMAGAYFANRSHFRNQRREMVENVNLSMQALAAKDKTSYTATNKQANEAFGKTFFSGIALFAASIWPVFFALSWLDWRFKGILFTLPLAGEVSIMFFFIPLYILTRVLFARVKPWLPVFGPISRKVKADAESGEQMMTYMDIVDTGKNKD